MPLEKAILFIVSINISNYRIMNRNFDTKLLRTFVAVANSGNMTEASSMLGLTQGAVSQQIKRLEELLQCVLLDRSRRGLKVTKRGEKLLGMAKSLLDLNDDIWREMSVPPARGEVRLGMPYDLINAFLPAALEGFVEANPNIEVTFVGGSSPELLSDVESGKVDVAVLEQPINIPGGERLRREQLLWVGCRDGSAYGKRPLPVSIVSESCAFRPAMIAALDAQGIPWRSVMECGNIDATMSTVRADIAVTASLASFAPSDLAVLGERSGLPDLPDFAINLHLRDDERSPAALELADHLRRGMNAGRLAS